MSKLTNLRVIDSRRAASLSRLQQLQAQLNVVAIAQASILPNGSLTGDIIRWNAATGAWEASSEPFALKQLVLTPAAAALLDREGGLWYKSTDKSVYVCTSDV